jgi:predicted dienelactone hydrolase
MRANKLYHLLSRRLNVSAVLLFVLAALTNATAQPAITKQPSDQFVDNGTNARLLVAATGTPPLQYQWFFNQLPLGGNTNRILSLTNVQPLATGDYFVLVSNASGSITSRVARLKVFVPAAHAISSVGVLPNRSVNLELVGEVTGVFGPYFDLYPLEVSSNLVDWTPLETLRRTNATLAQLSFVDEQATLDRQRFYRLPTNQFATFLPTPTGPFPVGVTSRQLTDPSRTNRRPFMVSVWYPAAPSTGVWPNHYIDASIASIDFGSLDVGNAGALGSAFKDFYSHSLPNVPLALHGPFAVVIYSPGSESPRVENTAQAENLASQGYIVVSIDHKDAPASVYPDGSIVLGSVPTVASSVLQGRVQDIQFVIDELERWNQNDPLFQSQLALDHLGVFGSSLGGETAVRLGAADSRCHAVLCLDGSANLSLPLLTQPFLYAHLALDFRPAYVALFSKLTKDAYRFDILNAAHVDGVDEALIYDTTGWGIVSINYGPPTEPHLGVGRILRIYGLSFFNKYLKGQDDHLLDGPLGDYPEIQNYTRK